MKRVLFSALAVAVMSLTASAQNANGTWTGETQGRGGAQQVTLTLNGTSGTWVQGDQESEVTEVAVNGNEVTFQRSVEFGGRGAFALTYNGVIEGNQLTLTVQAAGRGGPGGGGPGGGGPGGGGPGGGGPGGGGRGGGGPIVLTRQ